MADDRRDDEIHPAARAVIDPHLYRTDAEYHAVADMLTPILRVVEEALAIGMHLGPDAFLTRVAYKLLPTREDVERRQRENREVFRLMMSTGLAAPPEDLNADREGPTDA